MARGKTSKKMQIELRLEKVSAMYLSGKTQREIAEELGVSQVTISRDLDALQKRWQANAIRNTDALKEEELEKIRLIEREYWEAWNKSKAPRIFKSAASTQVKGGGVKKGARGGDAGKDVKQMEETTSDGDPRFLNGLLECSDRRRKIKGLDAATKIDYNDISKRPTESLVDRVFDLLGIAGANSSTADEGVRGVSGDDRGAEASQGEGTGESQTEAPQGSALAP